MGKLKLSNVLDSNKTRIEFLTRVRNAKLNTLEQYIVLINRGQYIDFIELCLDEINLLVYSKVLDYSISETSSIQSKVKRIGLENVIHAMIDGGFIPEPKITDRKINKFN